MRMRDIRVEAIEDIRSYSSGVSTECNGYLIARKGRLGWIDEDDAEKLSENHCYNYVDVLFDGNKIRRNIPNRSLKVRIEE